MKKQSRIILIAGGAGFIGRHLCKKLLQGKVHKVICVDNLSTGSKENIKEFMENPKLVFIEHDITIHTPITLGGDGSQTCSLQSIDDLVEGIERVIEDGVPHTPINLGNPNEMSVLELVYKVKKLTHSNSTISYKPLPKDDDLKQRNPDITFAKQLLHEWHPLVNIDNCY